MSIRPFARTVALALACVCLAFGSAAAQALNKSSLSFGNVAIGSTSVAKTVTLKNTRSVPLSIASITASNGFVVAAGTTCPSSPATLAAGASCVIAAAFAPTALGAASGAVTITHNAPSSPQTVALTGTGIEPVVVSPTALVFSNTVAGAVSATKNVAITNKLNTPLAFTSIVVSPSHFGIASTTCGATLAAGANCVVVVRFQPSAIGALTGSLTFTHNAVTSPHVVSLSGTATPPVTSSTNGLTFAAQGLGTTSTAQLVTLRNRTTGPLTVGPSSASGDFAVSATTCGVLAANATCTVSVRFSPTALGARAGTLTIPYSTAPGSPVTVTLAGQGDASSVQSIVVTPVDQSIVEGDSLAFTATGTFPGGTPADISTSVVWASADTSVVTISNTPGSHGVATALTAGSSIISATRGAISGSTLLNVTPLRQLLSIDITPADRTVLRGDSLQLTATGHYSDATSEDLTTAVAWSSTIPSVASVGNTAGSQGLVSALSGGTVTIGAALGGVIGTTGLIVQSHFSTTGSLSVARHSAATAVLLDGRVLIAGGWPSGATAELYDVTGHAFLPAGARTLHTAFATATLLANGKVLLAGGFDSTIPGVIAGAELFDPATNTFSPTGSLGQARHRHTATRLLDGRVLVVGGAGPTGYRTSAELYDPATGLFTSTGPLSTARDSHIATLLPDGRVLIAGGGSSTGPLASAEIYNPATGTFSPAGVMTIPRASSTAVGLDDGRVLIVGGYSGAATATAEIYNPASGTFTSTGAMLAPRFDHAAVLLTNGDVLVVGGWSGDAFLASADVYNLASGTFQSAGAMSEPRAYPSVALLGDGTVLIAGGDNASPGEALNSAELLTPPSLEPEGLVSIDVRPASPQLEPGGTLGLTATGTFSDGSSRVLGAAIWSSGAPSTVAVSNDPGSRGIVTALAAGESEIAASVGGISGATTVTVLTPLAVSEVSPADGLTDVARSTAIAVTFNSAISAATLTTNTADTSCTGSLQVSADGFATCVQMSSAPSHVGGNQYSVQPALSLIGGATYKLRVTTELLDESGQPLSATFTSSGFTTVAPALLSLTVSPDPITHALGDPLSLFIFPQLTAIATFSDGPTSDVTANVTWNLTPSRVGVFDASVPGQLRIGGTGTATVTATMGALTGTASLVSSSPAPTVVNGHLVTGLTHLRQEFMTVTKLADGRVLIAGGLNNVTGVTSSAELFDPVTNTLTATLPMSEARQNHTATLLADGRVLVAGGYGGEMLKSAEIFNPATGAWTPVADMNLGRYGHAAVRVGTKVLVIGGNSQVGGFIDGVSVELFDPATGSWTPTGSLNVGSRGGSAVVLPDGRVLLAGGSDSFGPRFPGEVYNPVSEQWTLTGNLFHARSAHALALLASGKVLIAGGFGELGTSTTAEIYDSATNTWSLTGDLPSPFFEHSATLLSSGQVLLAGLNGQTSYDPATGTFSTVTPLRTTRFKHAAVRLDDDRVMLVGGIQEPATLEARAAPAPPGFHVAAVQPADGTTGVPVTTAIDVTFSEPIMAQTLTVNRADAACAGHALQVSSDNFTTCVRMSGFATHVTGNTYRVQPALPLISGTTYQVRVTTALQKETGEQLAATFTSSGFTTAGPSPVSLSLSPNSISHTLGAVFPLPELTATATFTDLSTADVTASVAWSVSPEDFAAFPGFSFAPGRIQIVGTGTAVVTATLGTATATASIVSTSSAPILVDGHLVTGLTHARPEGMTLTKLGDGRVLIAGGFDSAVGLTRSAELFDPSSNTLTATLPMAAGRAGHTATLLADGRVLVAGGNEGFTPLKSAEIFDPANGSWTTVADMNTGRHDHVAVRVGTKVLVAGGDSIFGTSAELFDPESGAWTPTGSLNAGSRGAEAVVLPDGRVLLAGGTDPFQFRTFAEVYDPASELWTVSGSPVQRRNHHTLTRLSSGKVLMTGGLTDAGPTNTAEIYDSMSDMWSPTAGNLPEAVFNTTATLLPSGQVSIVGFYKEIIYDPATDTFSQGAPLAMGRSNHRAVLLNDGRVILVGGANEPATLEVIPVPLPPEPELAVVALQPADGATDIPSTTAIDVTFSVPINAATLTVNTTATSCTTESLQVSSDDFATCVQMSGAPLEVGTNTYRVQPLALLLGQQVYKVRVTTALQDATGAALPATFTSGGFITAPAIAYISVLPAETTVGLGKTQQLTAIATLEGGGTIDVTGSAVWTLGNPERGTVSPTGLVTVTATGFNNVSATAGGAGSLNAQVQGPGPLLPHAYGTVTTKLNDGRVLVAGSNVGGEVEIFDPALGLFVPAAPMNTPRVYGFTATRLADGRVLVAGGWTNSGMTAAAEIYDPDSDSWAPAADMGQARGDHVAVLVGTQVLVALGTFPHSPSAELFDPATGTWTDTSAMTTSRSRPSLTRLSSGLVLVAGGWDQSTGAVLASTELFDVTTGVWTAAGDMLHPRASHTATLLASGETLVAGGFDETGNVMASAELYDAATNAWQPTGSLPVGVSQQAATLLTTGEVFVSGGYANGYESRATFLYSLSAGVFAPTSLLAYSRSDHTSTLLDTGAVLLVGGQSTPDTAELRLSSGSLTSLAITPANSNLSVGVHPLFYEATGTFSDGTTGDMTNLVTWSLTPGNVGSMSPGSGANVLHVTGAGTDTVTASFGAVSASTPVTVSPLSTTTNNGRTVIGLTHVRYSGASAAALPDGRVLVAGGADGVGATGTAELYNPATGVFEPTGSMAEPRIGHTMTLLPNGKVLVTGGYNWTGTVFSSAELFDPVYGSWTSAGSMSYARQEHTATLVGGKVLVAGGAWNGGATAELYDPATGIWTETGAMTVARYRHKAVALTNGKVLVAGGILTDLGTITASAELYDPATGMWAPTGDMTVGRQWHTATVLDSGQVLVAGGMSNFFGLLSSAELYDPVAGTWSPTGSMALPYHSHTATRLPNGTVLLAGGQAGIGNNTTIYDPATGTFVAAPPLVQQRSDHAAVIAPDGTVFLIGGSAAASVELRSGSLTLSSLSITPGSATATLTQGAPNFEATATFSNGASFFVNHLVQWSSSSPDVAFFLGGTQLRLNSAGTTQITATTGPHTATASLTVAQEPTASIGGRLNTGLTRIRFDGMTATRLLDGRVLVTGGRDWVGQTASVELFDPGTNAFAAASSMAYPRANHTATLLPDGRVLVAGGFSGPNARLATAEVYDPVADSWTTVGSMARVRADHTATVVGKKVLVAGGNDGGDQRGAELFDPATGIWSGVGNLITGRARHTATLLPDGRVLVAGGFGTTPPLVAEIYDPVAGTWTATGSLSGLRFDHTATLLTNDTVLVAGGRHFSDAVGTTQVYDVSTGLWSTPTAMPFPVQRTTATLQPTGQVRIAGGSSTPLVITYDSDTGLMSSSFSGFVYGRSGHAAALLHDGTPGGIVLIGGSGSLGGSATADIISPDFTVTAITVSPVSPSVNTGATITLQATATFLDGSTRDVTNVVNWKVNDPATATVIGPGTVRGDTVGSTTVTASFGGVTDSVILAVN